MLKITGLYCITRCMVMEYSNWNRTNSLVGEQRELAWITVIVAGNGHETLYLIFYFVQCEFRISVIFFLFFFTCCCVHMVVVDGLFCRLCCVVIGFVALSLMLCVLLAIFDYMVYVFHVVIYAIYTACQY